MQINSTFLMYRGLCDPGKVRRNAGILELECVVRVCVRCKLSNVSGVCVIIEK
jgi:hypothetical protein